MLLHDDELLVDSSLVRHLVDRAFPDLSTHTLEPCNHSGSSNALFRLGDDMAVRLPRQAGGGASIEKEARWLPFVGPRLSVATPTVLRVGEPDLGYSERWAITTWLEGAVPEPGPSRSSGAASGALVGDLVRLVMELRGMEIPDDAVGDPSLTWYRGGPLTALDEDFRVAVRDCSGLDLAIDLDEALRLWDRAVEAVQVSEPTATWYHGDLLAENLLLDGHMRLAAVLDFGGLAIGNPTVDLIVAWELLDPEGRRTFRRGLDLDDATWTASRGWALFIAMITFPYYAATMPRRCADRLAMARAAIAGI